MEKLTLSALERLFVLPINTSSMKMCICTFLDGLAFSM